MSAIVEVQNLTKQYGGRAAVEDLKGWHRARPVRGFPQAERRGQKHHHAHHRGLYAAVLGSARVVSTVFHQSIQARRSLGYMPENAPLYMDMRVKEYLHFRGALKGLSGRTLRKRTGDVMDVCSLTESRRKIIATLSKGFRQRVALADALVSGPPCLLTDEPSNGLDPVQMRHVRELLISLRPKQTILLSTHILSEVERHCDRVLLIHRGRLRADDTPRNLVRKLRAATDVHLEVQGKGNFVEELSKISGVRKVTEERGEAPWQRFTLRVEARADIRAAVFELAMQHQWHIRELHRELPTLEDVFVECSGDS